MESESTKAIHITIDKRTILLILAICAAIALIPIAMHVMGDDELEITSDYHEVRYKSTAVFTEDRTHMIIKFTAEHDGLVEMKYVYDNDRVEREIFKYSKGYNEICIRYDPNAETMKATLYEKD